MGFYCSLSNMPGGIRMTQQKEASPEGWPLYTDIFVFYDEEEEE